MPEQFEGLVEIKNANATTISLDGASGDLIVGGGGRQGNLVIRDGNNVERFRLEGGVLIVNDPGGTEMMRLSSPGANIILKDNAHNERIHINSQAGDVLIFNNAGEEVIRLAGFNGDAAVGGGGQDGDLTMRDGANQPKVKLKSNPASIEVLGSGPSASIKLDGSKGDLSVGGGGQAGDVILQNSSNTERLRLEGEQGVVTFRKPNGSPTGSIDGDKADFSLGGAGEDGDLVLKSGLENPRIRLDAGGGDQGAERIYLDGASGSITAGGDVAGSLSLRNEQGKKRVDLSAAGASASLGGNGAAASVLLHPSTESGTDATKAAIALHASTPELVIRAAGKNRFRADGASGNVWVGGNGAAGHLVLFGSAATQTNTTAQARVHLDGSSAKLSLMDGAGKNRVVLDGNQGNLFMFDGNGKDTLHLRASDGMLRVGGNGQEGDVLLLHANNSNSVHISAATGDIVLANADCAEDFDLIEEAEADPGSVMVLDERGGVRQSSQPYDRSVVGVVAGAGGYRPGIVLDRTASVRPRAPLSMVGKAFCKVDATIAPVATGDLLTSSPTPGHAMKASDPARSFGAVLGKALRPLAGGTGLIPIVVALQ